MPRSLLAGILGLGLAGASLPGAAEEGRNAARSLGCTACHAAESQLVGPSFRAVAERYDGERDKILEVIQRNVANGSQGNWAEATGGTPMPPQPQAVGKTDKLERISAWIADLTP